MQIKITIMIKMTLDPKNKIALYKRLYNELHEAFKTSIDFDKRKEIDVNELIDEVAFDVFDLSNDLLDQDDMMRLYEEITSEVYVDYAIKYSLDFNHSLLK